MTYPGREATLGTILAIIAFGLLLVVNISTPIVKTLYLVKITRSDLASEEELTIGLWGYCGQNEGESKKCTSSKVGFAFDARRALNPNLIGTSDSLPSAPNTTLSYLAVVHIVALITLSIVTCVGGCAHTRKNRDRGLIGIAAQSSALAFILVLIAFIIDFIIFKQGIVNPINERVGSVYSAKVDVSFYLIIACLISSGLGTIGFFIGRIMNKQRRKKEEQEIFDDKEMNENIYSEPRNEDTYSEPRNEDQNQNVPTYCEYEEDVASYSPPSIHTPLPGPEYPNLSFSSGSQHGREYNLSIPPQPGKFSNPPYQPRIQNPPQPYSMGPSVRPLPPSPPVTQHQFYPQPSSYPNAYRSYSTTSPSMYPQDHYSQDHYPQDRYPQDHYPQDNYPQDNYNQPPYDLNSNIYNNQYEYPPKSSHRDQTQPPDNYYER